MGKKKSKAPPSSSSVGAGSSVNSGSRADDKPPPSKKAKTDETEWFQDATDNVESSKKEEKEEENEKLQMLVAAFDSKQLDQYEVFRRSTFQKGTVRRLIQNVCGTTVTQNVVIAMAGIAKVFVGEIVELGCQARDQAGDSGPLQPKHIREATRKLRAAKKIPSSKPKSTMSLR